MKLISLVIVVILVVFLFVAGCGSEEAPLTDESVELPAGMTDEEILQQFPDELGEALEELDQIE